ncbi:hypothetical protein GRI89_02870 [Altererythrobacter salegens]|uniref:Uncharacterized protein n=1 Tax=Croceibacterium salegens TaxID=1737568 RepID=A0A6I4SU66_9SPHN|nr:hypothetical protein [Croceibacterium salegens]
MAKNGEWAEYEKVIHAPAPRSVKQWDPFPPRTVTEAPSKEYLRRIALHEEFVSRLRDALSSAEWRVRALPRHKLQFEEIAPAALLKSGVISFVRSQVGKLEEVEIIPSTAEERLTKLIWFIEQVCSVVPPKSGMTKPMIQDLAERLFEFHVGDDVFKVAWVEAKIPTGYKTGGRPKQ